MKSVGIIPLRKGSKGIPGKNKKKLLGRPLYQWVLGEAIHSNLDEVYVFTDDETIIDKIKNDYTWTDKVKVFERSAESATDTASTETGMIELAKAINYDFDFYCLLQATSPLTTSNDINKTLNKVMNEGSDSALTAVNTKRFVWSAAGESLNYNYLKRPRRQDFDGMLMENGAVYVITKQAFLEFDNRLGGNIGVVEMSEESLIEIDEPSDWYIIEQLLANRLSKYKRPFTKIKALVLDVDGVFTDGNVYVSGDGELAKSFSLRDGMGLEIARDSGLEIIVMTSENSPIVDQRMNKLKINYYFKGIKDKYSLLTKIGDDMGIKRNEIAYIGDDVNDMANMLSVGWGFAPFNATEEIKHRADFVLHEKGGDKAIREGIEMIFKLNNRVI